ncbi:MAG: cytochrome c [Bacteroidia bacterium]|nr:cytochrome c [Bacteroidia bacterium]
MWYTFLSGIAFIGWVWGQGALARGEGIFQQRCAACHKLEQKLIGPPLARIQERRSKEWFLRFVANSQAMVQGGDAQAVAIYREYNQQVMPPFPDLGDQELNALWEYLNSVSSPPNAASGGGGGVAEAMKNSVYPGETRPMSKEAFLFLRQTFWLLVGGAVLVALFLGLVISFVSERQGSPRESKG